MGGGTGVETTLASLVEFKTRFLSSAPHNPPKNIVRCKDTRTRPLYAVTHLDVFVDAFLKLRHDALLDYAQHLKPSRGLTVRVQAALGDLFPLLHDRVAHVCHEIVVQQRFHVPDLLAGGMEGGRAGGKGGGGKEREGGGSLE